MEVDAESSISMIVRSYVSAGKRFCALDLWTRDLENLIIRGPTAGNICASLGSYSSSGLGVVSSLHTISMAIAGW